MENSLDLSKILEILKKNWWLLILLPLIFLLITLAITFFLLKPQYEASTQVLVNQREKNPEMMAQEVQGNIQLVNTYSEIVKSPRILDEVAKKDKKFSVKQIEKMMTVSNKDQSQILDIAVKSKNKADAERVANEVSDVFKERMPKIMKVDNVSILSRANGTATQVSPNPILNSVIAILLGLFLAIIILILKAIFDQRIKTEEDVERELNIPVLGSIHKLK
ncbi:Wzz/FepE/Etk N-terminal domain-containing protein [Staphylococcus petrasii]|uniref:Wzz/FepE/Etk N-terminal domain-containing protein n=1 Tax=Staphylococcus petrasii TaxID=1276936 RepID=UPI000CD084BD|nr:Wzz/FepE/Etk N-terminal domain-containing protein [Staphylococcus petrasii]PNZ80424.1 capsule biosynthesis protein CapA [Staphylococcus petrasii]TGA81514.1 capsule biosynthesis protein CapA [Staphylococcus petrasii]SUM58995.1 capsular polysaccharide synthesis enzyme CapA [Staphylococcus petrasii]